MSHTPNTVPSRNWMARNRRAERPRAAILEGGGIQRGGAKLGGVVIPQLGPELDPNG